MLELEATHCGGGEGSESASHESFRVDIRVFGEKGLKEDDFGSCGADVESGGDGISGCKSRRFSSRDRSGSG